MDPEATWRDVNDLRDDLRTRSESALALLCWLAKGGFCPGDSGTGPVVETCHALIVGYIDEVEQMVITGEPIDGNECEPEEE